MMAGVPGVRTKEDGTMSKRMVKWLLLGILGGMGAVFTLIGVGAGRLFQLSPDMWTVHGRGSEKLFTGLFTSFGVVMLVLGIGFFAVMTWRERQREDLFRYGTVVQGVVEDLQWNYAVQVNGRHPWYAYVKCSHPRTGEQVTLRSHSEYGPRPQIGEMVQVAFDPMDEKKYAVALTPRRMKE